MTTEIGNCINDSLFLFLQPVNNLLGQFLGTSWSPMWSTLKAICWLLSLHWAKCLHLSFQHCSMCWMTQGEPASADSRDSTNCKIHTSDYFAFCIAAWLADESDSADSVMIPLLEVYSRKHHVCEINIMIPSCCKFLQVNVASRGYCIYLLRCHKVLDLISFLLCLP